MGGPPQFGLIPPRQLTPDWISLNGKEPEPHDRIPALFVYLLVQVL
jgi:hypothetical protein